MYCQGMDPDGYGQSDPKCALEQFYLLDITLAGRAVIGVIREIIRDATPFGIRLLLIGTVLSLNKKDIGGIQQAKAAIGGGVAVLCHMASIVLDTLDQVIV